MIINNLELFFDKQEGEKVFFKTGSGEVVVIDEKLLYNFVDKQQKLFLNLDNKEITSKPQDVLNEILDTNNEIDV